MVSYAEQVVVNHGKFDEPVVMYHVCYAEPVVVNHGKCAEPVVEYHVCYADQNVCESWFIILSQ
jgi:hypothetical protein